MLRCTQIFTTSSYHPRRFISSTTRIILKENLPAIAYKPEVTEKNKFERWEKDGIFKVNNSSAEPVFSIVLPPPNVTGKLHLGHALSCTIQDVIARRKRSMGQNVLWLPGIDHAGIATQGVVEKFLKSKQNINRHDIGRERFNKEVWKWKEKHGNTICKQLRLLGCSLDWSREIFTMDPKHTNAVNTAFIILFQKGLIYRKKALVNWCNTLKSTVSDIEVENMPVNGPTEIKLPGYEKPVKFGLMYNFAYKIFDSDEEIVVSTTMPETMLGDTAIAIHPEDNRYQHLRGKRAIHPFRKTTIPIILDTFVDKEFGSGAVKITPAHSKIDYDVAKQHNLPLLQVIDEKGLIQNADKFNKIQRYECRLKLVQELHDMGLLKSITPHQMTLPTCSRTGDVIDNLPKEQWFVSCSELNKKARIVVERNQLKIEPDKFIKSWLNWTGDNRDWCISRQLWWGHQIPAYKCSVDNDVVWIAAADEKSAKFQASKFLRCLPEAILAERDTDVLDTWFSSGIYPFSAFGWPAEQNNADLKTFYPLSLMVTGHDILGFWVHRMVMLGLELTEKLPFNNILLHGIICDSRGVKMSKSRGNVIDPVDVVNGISMECLKNKTEEMNKDGVLSKEEVKKALIYHKSNFSSTNGIPQCGVDALRFTLLSQDIKSHFVNFDVNICHANKLFCNKIWQSIKYMQLSYAKLKIIENEISCNDLTYFDKWILSRLANTVDKVNNFMDVYDFHLATHAIRRLIYNEFCDVYLEATKPGFENENPQGYAHAHTLSAVLNTSLRCLAPFMIYVTEELIPKIPTFEKNIIFNFDDTEKPFFDFPQYENFEIWKNDDLEKQVSRVLNTINVVRELKGFYNISNRIRPLICVKTRNKKLLCDLEDNKRIVQNFTRSAEIKFNEDFNCIHVKSFVDKDTEVLVELIGENAENTIIEARKKLLKKIKKLDESLQKLEERYTSPHYLTTVPEWTQVLDKERLLLKKEELSQLQRLI